MSYIIEDIKINDLPTDCMTTIKGVYWYRDIHGDLYRIQLTYKKLFPFVIVTEDKK